MSGLVNKMKEAVHSDKNQGSNEEQNFSIQPHPAKSNDPADVAPQVGGGLNSNPEMQAHHARDPHVPSREITDNLEQPASREELRARAEELN